jgi:hypothetical protein
MEEPAPVAEEPAPVAEEPVPVFVSDDVSFEETLIQGLPELPPAPPEPVNTLQPDQKQRHSIANSNPTALDEAAKDPQIHEILDLFDGVVVDIHK